MFRIPQIWMTQAEYGNCFSVTKTLFTKETAAFIKELDCNFRVCVYVDSNICSRVGIMELGGNMETLDFILWS
jgi:hypothetical protein